MNTKKIQSQSIKHFSNDFLILLGILVLWLISYVSFMHKPDIQIILVIIIGLIYTLWGIWHHRKTKGVLKTLIIEYASMGLLIIALFSGYLIIFNF